jgi:hypothetical protein
MPSAPVDHEMGIDRHRQKGLRITVMTAKPSVTDLSVIRGPPAYRGWEGTEPAAGAVASITLRA